MCQIRIDTIACNSYDDYKFLVCTIGILLCKTQTRATAALLAAWHILYFKRL